MRRAESEKSGGAEKKKRARRGLIPCPAGGRAGREAAHPDQKDTMNPNPTTAAAATNRPDLYAGTTWGRHDLSMHGYEITPAIIANRNTFAEDWRLTKAIDGLCRYPPVGRGEDFDHDESYLADDGAVVWVVSNYGGPPPAPLGMVQIPPIFREGLMPTTSYAGRYESMRELLRRFKECFAPRTRRNTQQKG